MIKYILTIAVFCVTMFTVNGTDVVANEMSIQDQCVIALYPNWRKCSILYINEVKL